MPLLVIPPRFVLAGLFGIKVAIRPPYTYKRRNPLLRVPLDVLIAITSLLIVVVIFYSRLSSSTPFYYDRFRRINSVKPDKRRVVRLAPLANCIPYVISYVSRGAILVKVIK